MAETVPIPSELIPEITTDGLTLSDISVTPKWRVFTGPNEVRPGTSRKTGEQLIWSVSPGEWTVMGPRPDTPQVVELTHVRVVFRISGRHAVAVLNKICALDLTDDMFPDGAAGRTLVAGVATELVRDDQGDTPSYLLVPSRSFGRYIRDVIVDAAGEFRADPATTTSSGGTLGTGEK